MIVKEMYGTLRVEKLKIAQFQCLNFVNDDGIQIMPLCNFLNNGFAACEIELEVNTYVK